jgi:hypothetical protein
MINNSLKALIIGSYNSWKDVKDPECINPLKGTDVASGSLAAPKTSPPSERVDMKDITKTNKKVRGIEYESPRDMESIDDEDEARAAGEIAIPDDPNFDPSKATFAPKVSVSMDQTPESEAERIFDTLKTNLPRDINALVPSEKKKISKFVFDQLEDLAYEVPPDFDYEKWKELLQNKINTLPEVAAKLKPATKTESFRHFFNSLLRKK